MLQIVQINSAQKSLKSCNAVKMIAGRAFHFVTKRWRKEIFLHINPTVTQYQLKADFISMSFRSC